MKSLIYFLFAFFLSLQSILIFKGFYLSDFIIISLIIYSFFIYQKISVNFFSLTILLLILNIFVANLYNFYNFEEFFLFGFLNNFLKLISIALIAFFLPSILKKINLELFFQSLTIVIIIHSFLVIFDPFISYPWGFLGGGLSLSETNEHPDLVGRGRGLFEEPSFFAFFIGISSSLIIQYERLFNKKILKTYSLVIIFSGLIAAASLTALAVIILISMQLLFLNRKKIFKLNIKSFYALSISLPLIIILLSGSFAYLSGRITDTGNPFIRYVGGFLLVSEVIKDNPLSGAGLGGDNLEYLIDSLDTSINFELFELEKNFGYSSVTFWTSLIVAGGIPPLLIFYFMILGALIYKKDTRFYGFMLLILSMTKGDVFQLYLWTSITTAYSLPHLPNFNKGFFMNKNHEA